MPLWEDNLFLSLMIMNIHALFPPNGFHFTELPHKLLLLELK